MLPCRHVGLRAAAPANQHVAIGREWDFGLNQAFVSLADSEGMERLSGAAVVEFIGEVSVERNGVGAGLLGVDSQEVLVIACRLQS